MDPLLIATHGLLSAVVPTLREIAAQGLIDEDDGGEEPPRVIPLAAPAMPDDEDEPALSTMAICRLVLGADLSGLSAGPL